MKKPLWIGAALQVVLLLMLATASHASPVRIHADTTGRWDLNSRVFYMEGNVEVNVDTVTIWADELWWDLNKQELYVEGNVRLRQDDQIFSGKALVYDIDAASGEFRDVYSEVEAKNVKGPIFLFGDRIGLTPDSYHISDAKITTCEVDVPHYHVAVRDVEVYPGERMIIRHVTYYEGRIPLFYWPYLSIPLDDDTQLNYLSLPQVGYAADRGYYVKGSYNYYFNHLAFGTVHYDYYTRAGVGYGIRHRYRLSDYGAGSFFLYSIPALTHQQLKGEFEHSYSTDTVRFLTKNRLEQTLIDGVEQIEKEVNVDFNLTQDDLKVLGKVNYLQRDGINPGDRWLLEGQWQQTINPQIQLNMRSSATHDEFRVRRRMIDHLAELVYRIPNQTVTLALQQQYNPDVMKENATPNWRSISRIPEVIWQWRTPKLGSYAVPGRLEVKGGHYQEFPSAIASNRAFMKLDLNTRTWRPTPTMRVSYNGAFSAYLYEQGESQQVINTRFNLNQRVTPHVNLSASYTKQDFWGTTPFNFDRQSEMNRITSQIRYNKAAINSSLRFGYNFSRELYDNLIGQIRYRHEDWNVNISANYNVNTQKPGNVATTISYQPSEGPTLQLGTRYRLAEERFERIDGSISFNITKMLEVSYDWKYDALRERYTQGQFKLTLDLHCRELSFRYDHVREEFWAQYTINAFPTLPLRFSSTDSVSLFDVNEIQDLLGIEDEAR